MHVELILEEPAVDEHDQVEPFRRTSWVLWSKGQILAISGHSYRHRKTALAALERVTGGQVFFEGRQPDALTLRRGRGHSWVTEVVPIERVR